MVERLKAALQRARNDREKLGPGQTVRDLQAQEPKNLLPALLEVDWREVAEAKMDPKRIEDARIVTVPGHAEGGAAFDRLRSQLNRVCAQNDLRTIALTAPTRGCGTTTFALNLAFSFARSAESKVMLIDLHHRAPVIADRLGLSLNSKAKDAIADGPPASEILHRIGEALLIAPSSGGSLQKGSSRVSDSVQMIDRLRTKYRPDVVLLDLGPVLQTEATLSLLEACDAALLIASAEQTTADDLDECARRVAERTSYLGAVLNKSTERQSWRSLRELA